MKKHRFNRVIIAILVMPVVLISINSCSLIRSLQTELRAKQFDMESTSAEIVDAVNNKDTATLMSMMSPRLLKETMDIESDLNRLFDLIGEDIEIYDYKTNGEEKFKDYGHAWIIKRGRVDFVTSNGRSLRISFSYKISDTSAPQEQGLCLVRLEDNDKYEVLVKIELKRTHDS